MTDIYVQVLPDPSPNNTVQVTVPIGQPGPPGPPGPEGPPGSGGSYELDFTDNDLTVAGLLPLTHNLDKYPSATAIYDSSGNPIYSPIEILGLNSLSTNLSFFRPLQGTWKIIVST